MENDNNESASLRWLSGVGGILALAGGLLGLVIVTRLLAADFAPIDGGVKAYLTTFVIYHALWWCFFVSLSIVGLSLLHAAFRGRTSNLVPGPTLYVLGATLIVNGFFLLMFGAAGWAGLAVFAGAIFMYLEHQTVLI